jgi:hypothetical protein
MWTAARNAQPPDSSSATSAERVGRNSSRVFREQPALFPPSHLSRRPAGWRSPCHCCKFCWSGAKGKGPQRRLANARGRGPAIARLFAVLSHQEAAQALGISRGAAGGGWALAVLPIIEIADRYHFLEKLHLTCAFCRPMAINRLVVKAIQSFHAPTALISRTDRWAEPPTDRTPTMTTWDPQANELFLQALKRRSLGERQAYLDGACATGPLWSASFSPDGSQGVTAREDRTAKVWDANTGVERRTLKGHTDCVHGASFSPGGAGSQCGCFA